MVNSKKWLTPMMLLIGASSLFFLSGCKNVQVPDGVTVVDNFDINKYMGQWYEIARFDFKQEKDLSQVTANYSLNEDGSVKVLNRGFHDIDKEWKEANGKAKFLDETDKGALKVSFFGPFYSGYNVVMLDPDYQHALIFGESTEYIWFLSREKTLPDQTKELFLAKAKEAGYDLNRLVWTKQ
ncbi:lipocalin family protein [Sphingobacterium hungaricum]|uniref:Outer membrane lipoprotein Blc n=1 Tax=Sphingobacterium hungaricum TaxID=2082723 RepID=A0A928YQN3_9SPHI|nr:lipocalin family protein [Sphingobacterium hungaricum]MBE8714431.1 hypothetical protein [Sphingobacterium hungaricum]